MTFSLLSHIMTSCFLRELCFGIVALEDVSTAVVTRALGESVIEDDTYFYGQSPVVPPGKDSFPPN
jgi:hypothetical protein